MTAGVPPQPWRPPQDETGWTAGHREFRDWLANELRLAGCEIRTLSPEGSAQVTVAHMVGEGWTVAPPKPQIASLSVGGGVVVHHDPVGNTYQVSDDAGWHPGVYATRAAALAAVQVSPVVLADGVDARPADAGPITVDDLLAWMLAAGCGQAPQ